MWLAMTALVAFVIGLFWLGRRPWRGSPGRDLGAMSEQWLAEHKAGSR
jgi:hypothetical protein